MQKTVSAEAKAKKVPQTTQRVDLDTLNKIKAIDLHLSQKGVRLSQSEIIAKAVSFAAGREGEFMEYACSGELKTESTFDMIVSLTGKPWFPYGNLI
ncbi:MAG: hypothetical protein NTU61_02025 [Candidatus Altiarchaeota archaeon]|nr:hypothetical protein [Candidatus Altiarchaeota archaeon]